MTIFIAIVSPENNEVLLKVRCLLAFLEAKSVSVIGDLTVKAGFVDAQHYASLITREAFFQDFL